MSFSYACIGAFDPNQKLVKEKNHTLHASQKRLSLLLPDFILAT